MQDISTVSSDVEQAMTYEILQQYEKAQQKYKKSIEGQDMNSQVCMYHHHTRYAINFNN